MNDLSQFFGSEFDASTVRPMDDYTVVPPNKYPCLIEKSEIKENKARTGHFIEVTLAILDGEFKGRKIWDRINIDNPNRTAVEIATRVLSALVQAAGLRTLGQVAELIGKVVVAHVKVQKDQNGNDQNNVRTYSTTGASPVAPVAPVAGQVAVHAGHPLVQSAPVATLPASPEAPAVNSQLPWKQ